MTPNAALLRVKPAVERWAAVILAFTYGRWRNRWFPSRRFPNIDNVFTPLCLHVPVAANGDVEARALRHDG